MHTSVSSLTPAAAAAQPLPRSPVLLGGVLGLRPLDRVQIAPKDVRIECRRDGSQWPWRFYQRPLPDGRIEVASDAGAIDWIDPGEVVDVRRSEPIAVRAWSPDRFRDFLKLSGHHARDRYRSESEFHDAYLMRLEHDRFSRVDRVWVWFANPRLNDCCGSSQGLFPARLSDDSRAMLAQLTRRSCPVLRPIGKGRGNWSSDYGERQLADTARRRAHAWLRASLRPGAACDSGEWATDGAPLAERLRRVDALPLSRQQALDRSLRPVAL